MNTLTIQHIRKQLFFFAKEAVKHIVLESGCGLVIPSKELKSKSSHIQQENKDYLPLQAIYKKANCSLRDNKEFPCWKEERFKKVLPVRANAFMTLCLLELIEYYSTFKDIEPLNYGMSHYYNALARRQLEFFNSNLRNTYGLFVDKADMTEELETDYKLKEEALKFKFSDQALMMLANYKYSTMCPDKDRAQFYDFYTEILNLFYEFKNDVYGSSMSELLTICLAMNLLYKWSGDESVKLYVADLGDLISDKYTSYSARRDSINVENLCLHYINSYMLARTLKLEKYSTEAAELKCAILDLYDSERGVFIKDASSKECSYDCDEVVLYTISLLLEPSEGSDKNKANYLASDIFRNQLLNSGLITSWPELPDLDAAERYSRFSRRSEDLLEDHYFKLSSAQSSEVTEVAAVLLKSTTYNRRKNSFTQAKPTFDASRNMFMFFLLLHFFKD